jgi:hypothetical protein
MPVWPTAPPSGQGPRVLALRLGWERGRPVWGLHPEWGLERPGWGLRPESELVHPVQEPPLRTEADP